MYFHVQKWTSLKLNLFHSCIARDLKSPERANIANVSSKEVYFMRSLLDKQHEFSGTFIRSQQNAAEILFGLSRSTEIQ